MRALLSALTDAIPLAVSILGLVVAGSAAWYARSQAGTAARSATASERSAVASERSAQAAESGLAAGNRAAEAAEAAAASARASLERQLAEGDEAASRAFPRVRITGGQYGPGGAVDVYCASGDVPAKRIRAIAVALSGKRYEGEVEMMVKDARAQIALQEVSRIDVDPFPDHWQKLQAQADTWFVGIIWTSTSIAGGRGRHAVLARSDGRLDTVLDEADPRIRGY